MQNKAQHEQGEITIYPPRSFEEFLRGLHAEFVASPIDMLEFFVDRDFETWIDRMEREELFAWGDAYRGDCVKRVWRKLREVMNGI